MGGLKCPYVIESRYCISLAAATQAFKLNVQFILARLEVVIFAIKEIQVEQTLKLQN